MFLIVVLTVVIGNLEVVIHEGVDVVYFLPVHILQIGHTFLFASQAEGEVIWGKNNNNNSNLIYIFTIQQSNHYVLATEDTKSGYQP